MKTDTITNISKVYLVNRQTGFKTEIEKIESIKLTISKAKTSKGKFLVANKELNLSIDADNITDDIRNFLYAIDRAKSSIGILQNRPHDKKRINKKWAKRYGYTCTVYYE